MKYFYTWQRGSKDLFLINKGLLNILRLTWGDTTLNKIKAYYVLLLRLDSIRKANGLPYLCGYMKACGIFLMKSVGKDPTKLNLTSLGIWVSLTGSGIPRVIPSYFRTQIRQSNLLAVRAMLTVFNLYRVMDFAGSLNLATITDPSDGITPPSFDKWMGAFKRKFISFKITSTLSPWLIQSSGPCSTKGCNNTEGWLTAFGRLKHLFTWGEIVSLLDPYKEGKWDKSDFFKFWESFPPIADDIPIGKLAAKEEPGKVRIFAMVDAVTQWLLKPLHQAIFKLLGIFSFDGTFDQIGQLERFMNRMKSHNPYYYSFDLSAATDRLPLSIQISILKHLVSVPFSEAWGRLLVGRQYHLFYKKVRYVVQYQVGQPMGALSSWGMLALTHHLIVQYAAFLENQKVIFFKDYIVLGDDIVIADHKVAVMYHYLMTEVLKVKINPTKGIMSPTSLEFAKRFYVNYQDTSPISLKEFSSCGSLYSSFTATLVKYDISVTNLLSLMGKGGKARGNRNNILSSLLEMMRVNLFTFNKKDIMPFLQTFYPSIQEGMVRGMIIDHLLRSNKLQAMTSLLENGPDDYKSKSQEYLGLDQVSLSNKLILANFSQDPVLHKKFFGALDNFMRMTGGNIPKVQTKSEPIKNKAPIFFRGVSPLHDTVNFGLTPESRDLLKSLLLGIPKDNFTTESLVLVPTSKLFEIYFLDLKSLEVVNGHPFNKVTPNRSFLRNWEDIYLGLDLLKLVVSYRSCFDLHRVASGNVLISSLILRLEKETSLKSLSVVLVPEVDTISE
uniref:RNA-dependent RNA polymerase n=1 Tax=Chuzhou Mitov tick virus 1 TaxID=2972212 RepID=A0A9E7V1V6_9VIRU|nr:MAG: RNA-dependent RNA polymerase [Chuzhou Mitov tick virus 1]